MAGKKTETARLDVGGAGIELEVLRGVGGARALDISGLKAATGMTAFDPSLANTSICRSAITYIDGEKGTLLLRGYPIEDLAATCTFVEVAYLLVHGTLPTREERRNFSILLNEHSMLHEDMRSFFGNYPEGAHPMAVLSAMVVSLSSFYPAMPLDVSGEEVDITVTRLLSKLRTIAAFSYKKSIGEPYVYPSHKYSYCENFLNMMFRSPVSHYKATEADVRVLNQLLILHADHEQNASTTAVRVVGSTGANLYAAVSAGICALWGRLHGGANQAVLEMLEEAVREGVKPAALLARARSKDDPFRLMGFGHRIYKTYDPRAKIAKAICREVLGRRGGLKDPMLAFATELEEAAMADGWFQERHLYPNIDFYTGLIYRAMGFPKEMMTVLFALGRLPGWIAHWLEQRQDTEQRIMRPRQVYTGPKKTPVVPIGKRRD
ncbi:MAG: citrate synthase [Kiritimatiellae bacterium]|nr:citrate synthase [Kiritimatiellia bacterium]